MFKLISSNIREIVTVSILFVLLLFGLASLGSVAGNGPLSELLSLVVGMLGGFLKFSVTLALAWFGLSITFPEAGKFIFSDEFDSWWAHTNLRNRAIISLSFAAVLVLAAAICMAS